MANPRDFFGPRAATWDARFPDDEPAFSVAVRALRLRHGAAVLDAGAALCRLAGITRVGGHLALFRPVGRAALAERHGNELRSDDLRAPENVVAALEATGWHPVEIDDGESRYLAVARRVG